MKNVRARQIVSIALLTAMPLLLGAQQQCDSKQPTAPDGRYPLTLSPRTLSFGDVAVGQRKRMNFKVTNNGPTEQIAGFSIPSDNFRILMGHVIVLMPGRSAQVVVEFVPMEAVEVEFAVGVTEGYASFARCKGVGVAQ